MHLPSLGARMKTPTLGAGLGTPPNGVRRPPEPPTTTPLAVHTERWQMAGMGSTRSGHIVHLPSLEQRVGRKRGEQRVGRTRAEEDGPVASPTGVGAQVADRTPAASTAMSTTPAATRYHTKETRLFVATNLSSQAIDA